MGTLPMATQLLSGGGKARIQTRGAGGTGQSQKSPGGLHTFHRCSDDSRRRTAPGSAGTATSGSCRGTRLLIGRLRQPLERGRDRGPGGRRREMTQRRGSLKAPGPCAADGAGAFRGLPLLLREQTVGADGRARARAVHTGRAPGSSKGLAGRLRQLDQTADEAAPKWPKAALCPTLSMPRVCCERSALSARSPAFATRTWSSTGRRSPCRRTSWRPPARTSGEEGAAAGRAGPRCRSSGVGRAGPGVSPEPLVPTPPAAPLLPAHRSARGPSGGRPAGPSGRPLSFGHPRARPVSPADPRPPGVDPRSLGRSSPVLPAPVPTVRRSHGPPSRRGPGTPSWAGRGPAPASRAEPRPGPARGAGLKFAGRSPPNRAVGRAGAASGAGRAPPAEKPNKHFLAGCGQREEPVGPSPRGPPSDPRGRSSVRRVFFHARWELRVKAGLCVIGTR